MKGVNRILVKEERTAMLPLELHKIRVIFSRNGDKPWNFMRCVMNSSKSTFGSTYFWDIIILLCSMTYLFMKE